MIKPKNLEPGDKVAVVSLSSGLGGEAVFKKRVSIGIQRLQDIFGLEAILMPCAQKGVAYNDAHPELRAKDLMDAFLNPDIKGVICMIGGDDTIRLLPYINFDVIRNHPKIFMGYSDTTANHFMMYKAGLVSFHGPCLMVELAENVAMHSYTIDSIKETLFEGKSPRVIPSSPKWTSDYLEWSDPATFSMPRPLHQETHGYELLQGKGIVRGRLLGGCMGVMQMINGTDIWPQKEEWKDKLLFLETAEDYPTPEQVTYFLRNMVAQGIIHQITGIVVGKPLDEKYYEEYKQVYKKVIGIEAGLPDLPILYNVNCSHTAPVTILPYGVLAELNCKEKSLTILESAVTITN